ncbi:MAG TPA: hypothetical protein DEQ38_11395 [Elusimicrobia bacterium]|nr:MAG: hypothetical protein A2089_14120 [Elusimicrobia bacterium GWD2_63_28]HCC48702.1 hypothetical protein [Elusimicrobiota bacterium]
MGQKVKILYAEDSPADSELTLRELDRQGLENDCVVVSDLARIEELLGKEPFDILLSDFALGKFNAKDLLALRNRLAPELPFIIVTGTLPDEQAVDLLTMGATDYLSKDRLSRLPAAINRALAEKEERQKLGRSRLETSESEARYRELFECSSDIIFLVSLGGYITITNPAFRARTGWGLGQLSAMKAEALVQPAERERFAAALAAAAAGRTPPAMEFPFVSSSGKEMCVEGGLYPCGGGKEPLYVQGVFRDISEQRALEAQFRQAQKMEAIGRLAGGVAHDFNNILGAIEGYATLGLRKLDESDQLWADLTDIRKAVARASALTKQLLVFSRKHALRKEPVCPAELIDNLQKMVKRIIGENIAVSLEVAPGLPKVMADAGQLEQLLMNLFINARDAMPGGGVIKITAGLVIPEPQKVRAPNPASAGTQFLRIAVADAGTGMPPSVVEHLFEPFFTTKEKGKGTGLGLSTVYGIASQHNGWLEVVTAEGKGSEFSVFLPAGASVPVLPAPELPAAAAAGRGGGARLLIVEDDEDLRKLAVKALEASGYSTVSASSIAEAVSLFRNAGGAFDLVFSDIVLHDGNATQLIGVLLGIKPGVKFVFTSGYGQTDDTMDVIEGWGYKFMGKPYAIERLIEAIEGSLKS